MIDTSDPTVQAITNLMITAIQNNACASPFHEATTIVACIVMGTTAHSFCIASATTPEEIDRCDFNLEVSNTLCPQLCNMVEEISTLCDAGRFRVWPLDLPDDDEDDDELEIGDLHNGR